MHKKILRKFQQAIYKFSRIIDNKYYKRSLQKIIKFRKKINLQWKTACTRIE